MEESHDKNNHNNNRSQSREGKRGSSKDKSHDRNHNRDRDRDRDRNRDRDRDREREREKRGRDGSRDRERDRGRDRVKESDRRGNTRDRSRDRSRDRGRDRDRSNKEVKRASKRNRSASRDNNSDDEKSDRQSQNKDGKRSESYSRSRERGRDRRKGPEDRHERESKRAKRSHSRDSKPKIRSRSRSRSIASNVRELSEKGSDLPRRKRGNGPTEPSSDPVDENGQYVVGPKRERWRPSSTDQTIPPFTSTHSSSVRPPPPPLPPPKSGSVGIEPAATEMYQPEQELVIPRSSSEMEDILTTLQSDWQKKQQLNEESLNNVHWALELDDIHILEKYAGTDLFAKVYTFRQQQKKTDDQNDPVTTSSTSKSIEDMLMRISSADSKDHNPATESDFNHPIEPSLEENVLLEVKDVGINESIDISEKSMEIAGHDEGLVAAAAEEEEEKDEENHEISNDPDDFDLYGDLSGGLLAVTEEEEAEEEIIPTKNQESNNPPEMDDMYTDLLRPAEDNIMDNTVKDGETEGKDEANITKNEMESKTSNDFLQERQTVYQYFQRQHPSLPWNELPYLTQNSSIERMSLLSKSTRNQTFTSIFLKDAKNIRKLFT